MSDASYTMMYYTSTASLLSSAVLFMVCCVLYATQKRHTSPLRGNHVLQQLNKVVAYAPLRGFIRPFR